MRRSNSARCSGGRSRSARAPSVALTFAALRRPRARPRECRRARRTARRANCRADARAGDFRRAGRLAMRLVGAGAGRQAEADRRLAGDQRRPVGPLGGAQRVQDRVLGRGRRCAPSASPRRASARADRPNRRARSCRRSKCHCRRRARSAWTSLRWPAMAIASWLTPSIRSPSEART